MSSKGKKAAAPKELTLEEKVENLIARFDAFEQETHTVTAELRAQGDDNASKIMAMSSAPKTKGKNFTLTLATAAIMAAITDKSSFTHVKSTLNKLAAVKATAGAIKASISEVFASYDVFSKKSDAEKKKELKKIVCRDGLSAADLQSEFGEKVDDAKSEDAAKTDDEAPKKGRSKAAASKKVVDSDEDKGESDDDEAPVKKAAGKKAPAKAPAKTAAKSRQSRIVVSSDDDAGTELSDADVNDSD